MKKTFCFRKIVHFENKSTDNKRACKTEDEKAHLKKTTMTWSEIRILSSAYNFCKQFRPRSGPKKKSGLTKKEASKINQ